MRALADYVHSKGLLFGIYTDVGTETCGGQPGAYGHECADAALYAEWGVDFLKEDHCLVGGPVEHLSVYPGAWARAPVPNSTEQHRTAPNSTEQHRTDQHQRER